MAIEYKTIQNTNNRLRVHYIVRTWCQFLEFSENRNEPFEPQ